MTTPEGVELTLSVAGPVARARAWAIDMLIRGVLFLGLFLSLSALGEAGTGVLLASLFAMEWLYPVLCEVYWRGATPGKHATRLTVLHDDGTPVGWRAAVVRNTVRAVDFLPFFYTFGFIAMLLNRDFKRLGDLAAGTVVVHRPAVSVSRPANVTATEVMPVSLPLALPALTINEQRAVVGFAERRWRWSTERAAELATHAGAAIGGAVGLLASARLVALAGRLTGHAEPAARHQNRSRVRNAVASDATTKAPPPTSPEASTATPAPLSATVADAPKEVS